MEMGYWQVQMKPSDQHKTTFATHHGLFVFRVMAMGLSNSAATFEKAIFSKICRKNK